MSYYDDHVNPDTKWRELTYDELEEALGKSRKRNRRLAGRVAALSEQNRVYRRALKQLAENELDEHNCASVKLAGQRVRTIARRALEGAEQ